MQHCYEMGITRAEFLRLLPVAVSHAAWRIEGDDIAGQGTRPSWRIRLKEKAGRRFGAVELPVLEVTLDLEGASEAVCAVFVSRFLLGFQRAGG
jgi:hypothetical protein